MHVSPLLMTMADGQIMVSRCKDLLPWSFTNKINSLAIIPISFRWIGPLITVSFWLELIWIYTGIHHLTFVPIDLSVNNYELLKASTDYIRVPFQILLTAFLTSGLLLFIKV